MWAYESGHILILTDYKTRLHIQYLEDVAILFVKGAPGVYR